MVETHNFSLRNTQFQDNTLRVSIDFYGRHIVPEEHLEPKLQTRGTHRFLWQKHKVPEEQIDFVRIL